MNGSPTTVLDPASAPALQLERIDTDIEGAHVVFTAGLYAGGHDWSLRPFKQLGDEINDPERAARIASVCASHSIRNWYAPVPTDFNARVVSPDGLMARIFVARTACLYRGLLADGVVLPQGSGFMLSVGGCPIVAATDGETFIAAHAGLRSLIRYDDPLHCSVVENVARRFKDPSRVHLWTFFSIRQARYEHSLTNPKYAEASAKIINDLRDSGYGACFDGNGFIDLPLLIRMQAIEEGMICEGAGNAYLADSAYDTRSPLPQKDMRNLALIALHQLG